MSAHQDFVPSTLLLRPRPNRTCGHMLDRLDQVHMGRIVNDMLLLARADARDALALTERLDVGELIVNLVDNALAHTPAGRSC